MKNSDTIFKNKVQNFPLYEDGEYNDALNLKALKRVQKAAHGNGLNIKKITLHKDSQGYLLEFFAGLHCKISFSVDQKQAPGRAGGGEIITPGATEKTIRDLQENIQQNEQIKSQFEQQFISAPSKIFGADNQAIPLPIQEVFIEHINCNSCQALGRMGCTNCHGKAQMVCNKCHGSRGITCLMCRGSGRTLSGATGGQGVVCTSCQGRGQMACDLCRGSGFIPCKTCNASGQMTCSSCDGSGASSTVTTVKAALKTELEIYTQNLPASLREMLTPQKLSKLISKQDVLIQYIEKLTQHKDSDYPDAEEKMNEASCPLIKNHDDFIFIPFRIICPYAQLGFSFAGKKTFTAELIGQNAKLTHVESFLDHMLKKPFSFLHDAAEGSPQAASLIQKAARWSGAKKALIYSLKYPNKKAMHALLHALPLGLSKKMAKHLIIAANGALRKITLMPRYIALGGSVLLSGLLTYGWFGLGGRETLTNHPSLSTIPFADLIIDFGFLLFLGLASIFAIRFAAHLVLDKTLGQLGLEKTAKKWPKAGKAAFIAIALPFLFAVIILLMSEADKKPKWFQQITNQMPVISDSSL